ncbi:DUF2419 domain containing protein [Trichuris trichiura]|uniref:Queuosine 5'-phosphate N-glycosylase/hydrolase n=1 Tax=Trichuris trichiura TaxID=36087 RepID=A0A077ZFZ2_TRITR|nr:DUF2419 domain containing protein [Trichuris trichiura]
MHAEWNCDYLTRNNILDPWASVNYIAENAEDVKLHKEKLEEAAKKITVKIINGALKTAFVRPSGLHVFNDVTLPLKDAVDRWCFICAMSFSFWVDFMPGEPKYMIKSPDGLLWKGTRAVMVRFNQLIKKFDGSFYNCVKKVNNDPMQLMSLVLENFPCFRDIAIYKGQKVSFLLKAQLLVLGVGVLLDEHGIPGELFTYGEPSEVEMRAVACKCMQLITEIVNVELEKAAETIRVDCLDIDSFVDMDRIWSVAKVQRASSDSQTCGGIPTQGFTCLSRLYNFRTKDNRLANTTVATELERAGFTNFGQVGKILSHNESSICGFLQPVKTLFSNTLMTTYYIMNELLYAQRIADGYETRTQLGWAVPGVGMCGATQKIYELYKPHDGIIQVPESMLSQLLSSGYVYQGVSFAIWPVS